MESIAAEIAFMATSAGKAFVILMDPMRLMYLSAGCLMGLVLGIVPGIGGLAGTAMLLPFTFNMDPYTAFALLLGLGSTTATGDPIPAILFGVPGGAASAGFRGSAAGGAGGFASCPEVTNGKPVNVAPKTNLRYRDAISNIGIRCSFFVGC